MNLRGILATIALFGLIGVGLIGWGWSDYQDSKTASPEPSEVSLAELEADGKLAGNNHVRIGSHVACYYATVYSYQKKRFTFGKIKDTQPVKECYYAIVSKENPAVAKMQELEKKYGSLEKVPDDVDVDPPSRFAMIVKTSRFHTVGDIPDTPIRTDAQIQGLILNRTSPLGYKEKKLLKESFPQADFDKVLVLEEGRTPSSEASCFARIGIGAAVILLGFGLVCLGIKRRRRAEDIQEVLPAD